MLTIEWIIRGNLYWGNDLLFKKINTGYPLAYWILFYKVLLLSTYIFTLMKEQADTITHFASLWVLRQSLALEIFHKRHFCSLSCTVFIYAGFSVCDVQSKRFWLIQHGTNLNWKNLTIFETLIQHASNELFL